MDVSALLGGGHGEDMEAVYDLLVGWGSNDPSCPQADVACYLTEQEKADVDALCERLNGVISGVVVVDSDVKDLGGDAALYGDEKDIKCCVIHFHPELVYGVWCMFAKDDVKSFLDDRKEIMKSLYADVAADLRKILSSGTYRNGDDYYLYAGSESGLMPGFGSFNGTSYWRITEIGYFDLCTVVSKALINSGIPKALGYESTEMPKDFFTVRGVVGNNIIFGLDFNVFE